jgi:GNAT superfamily N-acetyltransferase
MSQGAGAARSAVEIHRLVELGATSAITAQIDAIFFQTSGRTFTTDAARAPFRQLWLGQYLDHDPDKVHLAIERSINGETRVLGYLVGCWTDPASSPRFASLTYFQDFAPQCHAFPGQLHVNLDAQARSRGIGRLLVEAFAAQSRAAGIPGIHVVTGKAARNARFYNRAGFAETAVTHWNGNQVVFLGRTLA